MSPMHKKVSLFWMQWGRVNSRHRVKKETRSMWVKHSHWERTNRFGGIWTRIPAMLATDPRKTANPQKARYTNDGRAQQWTEVIPHSTVDRMGDYFFFLSYRLWGGFFFFAAFGILKSILSYSPSAIFNINQINEETARPVMAKLFFCTIHISTHSFRWHAKHSKFFSQLQA